MMTEQPQPAGDATPAEPTFMQKVASMPPREQRTLGCLVLVAFIVLLVIAGAIYGAVVGDDREDAFAACAKKISGDVPTAQFSSKLVSYQGSDGHWIIEGTFIKGTSSVFFRCNANRISDGNYRTSWF